MTMQRVVPKGWRRPSVSFVRYYDDDVTVVAPPPSRSSPRARPSRPPPLPRPRVKADSAITLLALDISVEEEPVTTRRMLLGPPERCDVPPPVPYAPPPPAPAAPIAPMTAATRSSMPAMALMIVLTLSVFANAMPRLHRLLTQASSSAVNRSVAPKHAAK